MREQVDPAVIGAGKQIPGIPANVPGGQESGRYGDYSGKEEEPDECLDPCPWHQVTRQADHARHDSTQSQGSDGIGIAQGGEGIGEITGQFDRNQDEDELQSVTDEQFKNRREGKEENQVAEDVPPVPMG